MKLNSFKLHFYSYIFFNIHLSFNVVWGVEWGPCRRLPVTQSALSSLPYKDVSCAGVLRPPQCPPCPSCATPMAMGSPVSVTRPGYTNVSLTSSPTSSPRLAAKEGTDSSARSTPPTSTTGWTEGQPGRCWPQLVGHQHLTLYTFVQISLN